MGTAIFEERASQLMAELLPLQHQQITSPHSYQQLESRVLYYSSNDIPTMKNRWQQLQKCEQNKFKTLTNIASATMKVSWNLCSGVNLIMMELESSKQSFAGLLEQKNKLQSHFTILQILNMLKFLLEAKE